MLFASAIGLLIVSPLYFYALYLTIVLWNIYYSYSNHGSWNDLPFLSIYTMLYSNSYGKDDYNLYWNAKCLGPGLLNSTSLSLLTFSHNLLLIILDYIPLATLMYLPYLRPYGGGYDLPMICNLSL
jgi:zinc finger protein CreA/MIG